MIKRQKNKNSSVIWNKKIYMDEKVYREPIKYRRRIERGKLIPECFCISLSGK